LVGQELRQSWSWSCLALLWVLHWVNCGSLSVGSLGSWSWSWCVSPGVVGARIQAILELVMLSFALGPPLGQLWFLECGKLRVLELVLVCESWSWWGLLGLGWLVGLGGVWMLIVADMMKLTRLVTFAASQHLMNSLWMLGLGCMGHLVNNGWVGLCGWVGWCLLLLDVHSHSHIMVCVCVVVCRNVIILT
jgi:hypothetical protein